MKILYISPINTVGTLDLWKKFHESKGHECTYLTLCKSPLGVNNGICLNLPLVAHSKISIFLRRMYYQIIRGGLGDQKPKLGFPPIYESNSSFESIYFKFRDWLWSFKLESIIKKYDLESYDIYHLEWGLGLYRDARFIKRLDKKKIICTYHGQDLRTRGVLPKIDEISDLNLTSELDLISKHPQIKYLFLPIDIKQYEFKVNKKDVIRICHSPTNRYYKGSDDIISVCEKLEKEYDNVEFILIEKKSQEETLKIKSTCDILVDQINDNGGWGYGMSSIEAMAMGLCCATEMNETYEKFIPNHPFININKNNIYEKLSELINKPENIQTLKKQSRNWVKDTHDIKVVGAALYEYYKQDLEIL